MTINFLTQDMEIPPHCIWMANRLILGRRGCTHDDDDDDVCGGGVDK